MKFAIRDDDTSFWTDYKDLEKVYMSLFGEGYKVSLAVIPNAHKLFFPGDRKKFYLSDSTEYVYRNNNLVNWIKEKIKENRIEIMLHGFNHAYFIKDSRSDYFLLTKKVRDKIDQSNEKYTLIPELGYKDYKTVKKEIRLGKEILEDTFSVKISTFVPPSNTLNRGTVKAVIENRLNVSGIIGRNMNRPMNFYTIKNYLTKNIWRVFNDFPYPRVLDYHSHKEVSSRSITPLTNFQKLINDFNNCQYKSEIFNIATHYWELLENEKLKQNFYSLLEHTSNKTDKVFISDLFSG